MRFHKAVYVLMVFSLSATSAATPNDPYELTRERMVRDDIAARGVTDARVLESMRLTPRHEFVSPSQRALAYIDMSLPIGEAQTISGPFVVAYMTEKLEPKPTDKVLEIGTGSGYQAAVLSSLVGMVYSIEIHEDLGKRADRTLRRLGYRNVVTKIGDGFAGWKEHAPFDKIIVTCSPEDIPQPLVDQLAEGGMMVIPVGERYEQILVRMTKKNGKLLRETLVPSLFVPMTGEAEESRETKPDGKHPQLSNGDFEETIDGTAIPVAWYYGRQATIIEDESAPSGGRCLQLHNAQPGRPAQLFQGFPVDGKAIRRLAVTFSVRGEKLMTGVTSNEVPAVAVYFYDAQRSRTKRVILAPMMTQNSKWLGNFGWKRCAGGTFVPLWAREGILQIGLMGASGTLALDSLQLESEKR